MLVLVVSTGALSTPIVPQESDGDQTPTVRLARPTWDTGWFQAEIQRILLERLGFEVHGPVTMENEQFYAAVSSGDVDLWANGWFPLHAPLIGRDDETDIVGTQVSGGALQGYLVDIETAERLGIDDLSDLSEPEIAEVFDVDGNGLADLIGCNLEWACGPVIDHHLQAYGLTDTVEQVQADYSPLMEDTVRRFRSGEPVLFYTFTPNWTVGRLRPGVDVKWLEVPFPSLPAGAEEGIDDTTVPGLAGCVSDPCDTGWPINDIRGVANRGFLSANPQVRTLLEQVEIPLEDILEQNAAMVEGEGEVRDIISHAERWVVENEATVSGWIEAADPDAIAVSSGRTGRSGAAVRRLSVAVRTFEPFVSYQERTYGGFSVELIELLAARVGAEVDMYGVNTIAKQIDDVERGAADLAIGGISITSERERAVDFTVPVFDTGLAILVPVEDGGGVWSRIGALARAIFTSELPWMILLFVLVLLLSAHVIWWFERRDNPDFPELYGKGIWDSFWWSAVTITTVGYGDKAPKGVPGRGFALLWMFAGYFVFASFTASITSSLAVEELRGTIEGPADLKDHTVATVTDSDAAAYLVSEGIGPVLVPVIGDAYELLENDEVDAVVFDAPILQFHASHDGRGRVRTVGPVFEQVRYGIAVSGDQPDLEEALDVALLELVETGIYDQLHDKWFGAIDG
jgi:ABC-type proline/glycine betaine transport system substrate-binding protein/ABC-type amino acid transport substrate-binding protein